MCSSRRARRRPHLKAQGREAVFKRELPEDADEDEFYTEDELEEGPELLASLEEDAQLANEQAAWTPVYRCGGRWGVAGMPKCRAAEPGTWGRGGRRLTGCGAAVCRDPPRSSSSEAVKKQAGGLRSLVWPGAVCGGRGADWTCVYVGWGVKNAAFVPLPPPPVAVEFDAAAVETQELDLKPAPPPAEEEEEAE